MKMLKVGALVPTSRLFPGIDRDFLAGLQGALTASNIEHQLIVEPGGNLAAPSAVSEKIQRLLLQHRPHVVTGILGSSMLRHVHDFFSDGRTPFIVNNAGADPALDGGVRNPYIFHNSLNIWQSVYALGNWAARNIGATAAVAIGFHEAGYGIVSAFSSGFTRAGGTVVATAVTHRDSSDQVPLDAISHLASSKPDFIMGLYSGRSAVTFMQAYANVAASIPLLASPFLPHQRWLDELGPAAAGLRSARSWDSSRESTATSAFRNSYAAIEEDDPDVFGLLGYETGLILADAASRLEHVRPRAGEILSAIGCAAVDSPRGLRRVDSETGDIPTSDTLVEVRSSSGNRHLVESIARLELPSSFSEDHAAFKRQDSRVGWTNPYLVT